MIHVTVAIMNFNEQVNTAPFEKRTHTCGSLSFKDVDSKSVLMGWLVPKGYVRLIATSRNVCELHDI